MSVSIIIPAYNAAKTLSETIHSLFAQTFSEWEAIIVNDGSTDETGAIATQFTQQDPRIHLIQQSQAGVCAARNAGIERAQQDWLLFLDADDWIAPTHLECLLEAAQQNRDLDAVYSHWTRVTPDGVAVMDQEFSFQSHEIFAALARNCVLAIHACLVKREIVVALGGFDVSLKTCEDWDLWQRIARTGARFGAIPEAGAYYRIRPGSLSHESLQVFTDGLRVITTGHSPDPRVPHPSQPYAQGMPAAELPGVRLTTLCWYAGLLMGQGEDPLALFAAVQQDQDPGLDPDAIALSLFWSTFLPTGKTAAIWVELWEPLQQPLDTFLTTLEQQSQAEHLKRRVCQRLETLIQDHATVTDALTLGLTHGITVEVTQPITDIAVAPVVERLHCRVRAAGKLLGTLLLPVCDGQVAGDVLRDAIAARFTWELLGEFFQASVYQTLRFQADETGVSVWRDRLKLADYLPAADTLLSETHHRIGWTVFLQELWRRPSWPESFFYYQQGWKLALRELQTHWQQRNLKRPLAVALNTPTQTVGDGWIKVELTQELPHLHCQTSELRIIPTMAGVPLGIIPLTLKGTRLAAQALRALIIRECAGELAIAAVRQAILGQPFNGDSLHSRLRQQNHEFPVFIEPDSPFNAKPATASPTPDSPTPFYPESALYLPRYSGAIGTSSNRRATLPAQVAPDLQTAANLALLGTAALAPVQYRPELLSFSPTGLLAPSSSRPLAPAPTAINPRALFETIFATQADPWHYTSPYEQIKYEQTLAMVPPIKLRRVLEVACAEGHFTQQLAPLVENLLAVDVSQVALERAAERCAAFSNIQYQLFDLTQDSIPGSFDLILCSEVLYYVGDHAALAAFAHRVAAALATGGYFLHAHANLIVDEPDQPGYDWGHPFGAKGIGEAFAKASPLRLVRELHTPLYRVQLFCADSVRSSVTEPEITRLPLPAPPPPYVATDVRWQGGTPTSYTEEAVTSDRLPILMYHRVHAEGSAVTARYRVTPAAFEQQLKYLRDAGYYSITLDTWREAATRRQPLPGRPILITFDDGYRDCLTDAFPLLQKYGFSAMVFLVAEAIGGTNDWDRAYGESLPLLNWAEIKTLQAGGIEFGAHASTHRPLTALSPTQVAQEGVRSRAILQQGLGYAPQAFAYPYGDTDALVQHLVGACGFVYGLSCQPGLSRFQDNLLALPRIEVTGDDDLRSFIQKLSG